MIPREGTAEGTFVLEKTDLNAANVVFGAKLGETRNALVAAARVRLSPFRLTVVYFPHHPRFCAASMSADSSKRSNIVDMYALSNLSVILTNRPVSFAEHTNNYTPSSPVISRTASKKIFPLSLPLAQSTSKASRTPLVSLQTRRKRK